MFETLMGILLSKHMIYITFGTMVGIFVGAVPGLSSGTGIIMVLPLTFYMDVKMAMSFLLAIYVADNCAGGITSVYFNIPGTPSAAITALDGYPLAQKGKLGQAAGLVIGASFFGGFLSYIVLYYGLDTLGKIAYKFGPMELFFTALLGVICAVGVKGINPYKSLASGLFGLLIGTIGYSPTGAVRATFGMIEFLDGVPFFPLIIGMLCMSEVLSIVGKEFVLKKEEKKERIIKEIFSGIFDVFKEPLHTFYSAMMGVFIGILPGQGGTLSSFLSYTRAKQSSKNPDEYGTGVPRGVIAAEAANSASVGGGLLTSLLLGIPGTATCAILLAALMLHGIQIGPILFRAHQGLVHSMIGSLFVANIVMFVFAIIVANYFSVFVHVPTKYLVPVITIFCSLGTYMVRYSIRDVWIFFFSSILAIVMKNKGYPPLPLIVAVMVAPIADAELIRAIQIHQNRIIGAIFKSPINWILIVLNILLITSMFRLRSKSSKVR
ncbi:hypothetical protein ES707_22965 [subsurface metagenome]